MTWQRTWQSLDSRQAFLHSTLPSPLLIRAYCKGSKMSVRLYGLSHMSSAGPCEFTSQLKHRLPPTWLVVSYLLSGEKLTYFSKWKFITNHSSTLPSLFSVFPALIAKAQSASLWVGRWSSFIMFGRPFVFALLTGGVALSLQVEGPVDWPPPRIVSGGCAAWWCRIAPKTCVLWSVSLGAFGVGVAFCL